ncbi:sugar isomerase domain-containing protein [Taklimakanibacter lacteus]|uniref:sugar isomerase domain-containing protein n=1 Tax=Taklimakanibacter lacteus TaxID=2268456 RepID=UPI000E663C54
MRAAAQDHMTLIDQYCDSITDMLKKLVATQRDRLATAQSWVADALAEGGLVYVTGSGHSHIIAEEVFYRAGGAAAVQAILDPALMLHQGAQRSTVLERLEGYAEIILEEYPIGPRDVLFVASNSGRNAFPIEAALFAHERGAKVIAITSSDHAAHVTSRHKSGKMLSDVADLVIDNQAPYGDACLAIPNSDKRMGSTSTISGTFIINAVMAEAVANLTRRGIPVDIYRSANSGGGNDAGDIVKRWRPRIRGL